MARNTGHRSTVAWIVGGITGRVTEGIMIFVTADTNLVPLPLQHRRIGRPMQLMAIETALGVRMEVETLLPPGKFSGMTTTADLTRVTAHQTGLLTGVRSMAVETERTTGTRCHVVEQLIKTVHNLGMAAQAGIPGGLLVMTRLAVSLLKRLMLGIT
jgi:hypothetical protein